MTPAARAASEFRALARDHTVVPVWRELLADLTTPGRRLRPARAATTTGFLLESVEHGERWSRWSFVGPQPAGHARRPRRPARGRRARCPTACRSTRGSSPPSRHLLDALPVAAARRPAAAARRARRLPRLRRRARGRAPARRPARRPRATPTPCSRSSASSPPSTTGASGSRSSPTCSWRPALDRRRARPRLRRRRRAPRRSSPPTAPARSTSRCVDPPDPDDPLPDVALDDGRAALLPAPSRWPRSTSSPATSSRSCWRSASTSTSTPTRSTSTGCCAR